MANALRPEEYSKAEVGGGVQVRVYKYAVSSRTSERERERGWVRQRWKEGEYRED